MNSFKNVAQWLRTKTYFQNSDWDWDWDQLFTHTLNQPKNTKIGNDSKKSYVKLVYVLLFEEETESLIYFIQQKAS